MTQKGLISKLTPNHFPNGESFDIEVLASLKRALPKQKRNTVVLSIVGALMLVASVILVFTVGGIPLIPCWLTVLVLSLCLQTAKWDREVKVAKETLGISNADIKNAVQQLKKELHGQLVDAASAAFLHKEGYDREVFGSVVSGIQKQKRDFWKLPAIWLVVLFVGSLFFMVFLHDILRARYLFSGGESRIAVAFSVALGLLLGYWPEWQVARGIEQSCAKLGIIPDEARSAIRQAEQVVCGTAERPRKRMAGSLIWAMIAYILLLFLSFAAIADGAETEGVFLVLLYLGSIAGTILLNKRKRNGHLLTLLPIAASIAAIVVAGSKEFVIAFGMFSILPYFFVRFFICKNGLDKLSVRAKNCVVYGTCVLLLATATVLLSSKSYRVIYAFNSGMAQVESKEGKWGFINTDNEEIIPCMYDDVTSFALPRNISGYWYEHEDKIRATACLNGKWGVIDRHNQPVIPFEYDAIGTIHRWTNALGSLWSAQVDGKWGVIDSIGNTIVPFEYDGIDSDSNARIEAKLGDKKAYFDVKGTLLDIKETTSVPRQKPVAEATPTLKIVDFDLANNRFSFVDIASGKKLTYRSIVVGGQPVVKTECVVKDGEQMLRFILKEKQLLDTRQENGRTISTFSGESYTAYSIHAELKYEFNGDVLYVSSPF